MGMLSKDKSVKRSEEHTSELQSQFHLVCRLLLEKNSSRQFGAELSAGLCRIHLPVLPGALPLDPNPHHTDRAAPGFQRLFFNDTATTEIYTLSLHDALPI